MFLQLTLRTRSNAGVINSDDIVAYALINDCLLLFGIGVCPDDSPRRQGIDCLQI